MPGNCTGRRSRIFRLESGTLDGDRSAVYYTVQRPAGDGCGACRTNESHCPMMDVTVFMYCDIDTLLFEKSSLRYGEQVVELSETCAIENEKIPGITDFMQRYAPRSVVIDGIVLDPEVQIILTGIPDKRGNRRLAIERLEEFRPDRAPGGLVDELETILDDYSELNARMDALSLEAWPDVNRLMDLKKKHTPVA